MDMLKGESIAKHLGVRSTFLSEDEVADQYQSLKQLTSDDLKLKSFFAKKRNFFIQVANDKKEMHDHFYHLKKICRKKSQPLYLYKIDPATLDKDDLQNLKTHFHIDNLEELSQTGYILINEDGLRLPQPAEDADSSVSEMFLRNPVQISNLDELYDLLEMNAKNPTKYIFIQKQDQMNLQNKIFRKAFYENSQVFQDMAVFAEISNNRLARKVGIESPDQIVICQNKN